MDQPGVLASWWAPGVGAPLVNYEDATASIRQDQTDKTHSVARAVQGREAAIVAPQARCARLGARCDSLLCTPRALPSQDKLKGRKTVQGPLRYWKLTTRCNYLICTECVCDHMKMALDFYCLFAVYLYVQYNLKWFQVTCLNFSTHIGYTFQLSFCGWLCKLHLIFNYGLIKNFNFT